MSIKTIAVDRAFVQRAPGFLRAVRSEDDERRIRVYVESVNGSITEWFFRKEQAMELYGKLGRVLHGGA